MVADKTGKQCVHCGASDTPLWRVGPMGPKTLCNACGLRWRKTGRLVEDDENAGGGQHHQQHHHAHRHHHHIQHAKNAAQPSGVKKVRAQQSLAEKKKAAAKSVMRAAKAVAVSPYSTDDDHDSFQFYEMEQFGVQPQFWPPAVEAFRRSAVRKVERSYTLDDFWPYYRNVFSGLMVVHKSHR